MPSSSRLLAKYKELSSVRRVVARHKAGGPQGLGKFLGKNCRLQWSSYEWKLEELPQKGKKKLRVATLQNPSYLSYPYPEYLPNNLLRAAKLTASDSYDDVKDKIQKAYDDASENYPAKAKFLKSFKWSLGQAFYLNVIPEGVDEFEVEGKDFTMSVEWTQFQAYSPSSDFELSDPHYSKIVSKSATSARKLYLILKENPNALKNVSWAGLDKWLTGNKVQYAYQHSSWS